MALGADAPSGGDALDRGFDISYRGRAVQITVRPACTVTVDEVAAALESTPLDTFARELVETAIEGQAGEPVGVGEVEAPPGATDGWFVKLSPDRLAAYAVPAPLPESETPAPSDASNAAAPPPEGEAREERDQTVNPATPDEDQAADGLVSADVLRDRLEAAGVTSGIIEDVLQDFDPPRPLLDIRCVARGEAPTIGHNARISFAFDRDPQFNPVRRQDGSFDYHATAIERFVEAGAVLATRQPPVPGMPGRDVLGRELGPPNVHDEPLSALAGRGTEVQGETLIATEAGRPSLTGNRVEVSPVYEVAGDLDYSVGNIEFSDDVVVRGDVRPGFSIVAGGSVVVHGVTESACIKAERDITLAGVVGGHETALEAGGDLMAQYLHNAAATATGTLKVAKEIVNCTIDAERVSTPPSGRVVGGSLSVRVEVDVGTLGSVKAVRPRGSLSCRPPARRSCARVKPCTRAYVWSSARPAARSRTTCLAPRSGTSSAGSSACAQPPTKPNRRSCRPKPKLETRRLSRCGPMRGTTPPSSGSPGHIPLPDRILDARRSVVANLRITRALRLLARSPASGGGGGGSGGSPAAEPAATAAVRTASGRRAAACLDATT